MAWATIALGSNLGDRLAELRTGVRGIEHLGRVAAVSSLYETEPVGGPAQGRYLNAVVLVETDLEPEALLEGLHAIEGDSERTRDVRWGPRTLDLDLITYDDRRISDPHLEVPHPRAHERRFVLAPLLDVAPDIRLADGRTPRQALGDTADQQVDRWEGPWVTSAPDLGAEAWWWVAGQFVLWALWLVVVVSTATPPRAGWLVFGGAITAAGLTLGTGAVLGFGGRVTPSPQPREGAELVERGVYRMVRHPMYGGVLLAFLGLSVAAGSPAAVGMVVILGAFFRVKSAREERSLAINVPGYEGYRRSVSKRFIPWVW